MTNHEEIEIKIKLTPRFDKEEVKIFDLVLSSNSSETKEPCLVSIFISEEFVAISSEYLRMSQYIKEHFGVKVEIAPILSWLEKIRHCGVKLVRKTFLNQNSETAQVIVNNKFFLQLRKAECK